MKPNGLLVHLKLLIRPAIIGWLISGGLWYRIFFPLDWHFLENDESAFTDSIIPTLAMFHAIVAGQVLLKVLGEYQMVQRCVRENDKDTFLRYKHDRIPVAIHLLLGSMSVLIQSMVLMIHFEGPFAGIMANFSVAFVLTLYWEVATNLDDPSNGVWYVGQIPKEWL